MHKNIPDSIRRSLFKKMLRLRVIEETIAEIYPNQEMKCPTHLCTGQEAIPVGVCENLNKDDTVFYTHRSHGWYIAKGGDLKTMVAEIFGKSTGCCGGWGGSMHLIDLSVKAMGSSSIVGGSLPHAVGVALSFGMLGLNNVSIAAFGDGCVEEGVFHESLNFAMLKKLPIIFICENNLYATQSHIKDRQPHCDIYKRADSYGIPGVQVDGNDVIAIFNSSQKAIDAARNCGGPTLIECRTYRWREHVGPNYDYDLGYRTREELLYWMDRCPIKKIMGSLEITDEERIELENLFRNEMQEAIDYARSSPFPITPFDKNNS